LSARTKACAVAVNENVAPMKSKTV